VRKRCWLLFAVLAMLYTAQMTEDGNCMPDWDSLNQQAVRVRFQVRRQKDGYEEEADWLHPSSLETS
jgi:hypothetical protein